MFAGITFQGQDLFTNPHAVKRELIINQPASTNYKE